MRWLLEAFLICMNSSALDLLVHVDFPVSDMSDAVKRGGGEGGTLYIRHGRCRCECICIFA